MSDYFDSDEEIFDEPASKVKGFIDIAALRERLNLSFEIEDASTQNEVLNNERRNNSIFTQSKNNGNIVLGGYNESDSDSDFDAAEPFEYLSKKMRDISQDGGVFKKVLQEGIGGSLPEGAYVTYHYTFYLELADEPFDSSLLRKPCKASLKDGEMISGMSLGLNSMRKKEKALFIIRSDYAFGAIGCPPRIPGGASILTEITLIDFADYYAADAYDQMEENGKMAATFEEKLNAARAYQRKGTDSFKHDNMYGARNSYCKALWVMRTAINRDENDEKQQMQLMFRMHANLAQVHLKLHNPAKACTECQEALKLPGSFSNELKAKLYFRFGKAKMLLNSFDEAGRHLKKAQKLSPNSPDISKQLIVLYEKEEINKQRETLFCQNIFQNLKVGDDIEKNAKLVDSNSESVEPADTPLFDDEISGFEFVTNCDEVQDDIEEVINEDKPRMSIECFEEVITEQLRSFSEDSTAVHISLPTGLTREEIKVAKGVATKMSLLVDTEQGATRSHLMVYKMLKENPIYKQREQTN